MGSVFSLIQVHRKIYRNEFILPTKTDSTLKLKISISFEKLTKLLLSGSKRFSSTSKLLWSWFSCCLCFSNIFNSILSHVASVLVVQVLITSSTQNWSHSRFGFGINVDFTFDEKLNNLFVGFRFKSMVLKKKPGKCKKWNSQYIVITHTCSFLWNENNMYVNEQ